MKKIFQKYIDSRLQTKLAVSQLILVLIPMIVMILFFSNRLFDMILADTIKTEQTATAQTAPLIEDYVSSILDIHKTVRTHEFCTQLFSDQTSTSLNELSFASSSYDFHDDAEALLADGEITDIKIYLDFDSSESVLNNTHLQDYCRPVSEAKKSYWYGIFSGTPTTNQMFCPSFYLSPTEIKNSGDIAYISRGSMLYNNDRVSYYVAVYFTTDQLNQFLTEHLSPKTSVAYILNARDSIITSTNSGLSSTYYFDYATVQDSFMSSNNFITKHILGEDVYAGFYSLRYTDWFLVVAIPSKPLILQSQYIIVGIVFVYLFCIVCALLIANYISRSITKRLSLVIHQMSLVRQGPPVSLPASEINDEIGELTDTYNYMTHMIQNLLTTQAQAAEDLRVAEFHSLQAQINPHFLYNTMDMINWLSKQGRSEEVSDAIKKLSRFYKLTLSRKELFSSVSDELEHAAIYMDLQNMRFNDEIEFIIDVPDTLLDYSIPKLTLQPLVENSILHGIMEKEDKSGTILITGWQEGKDIVLLLSDDGVGIPDEKLQALLSNHKNASSKKGHNIAVYNTHRRLQLLYGNHYGLRYTSTEGNGTVVEIRFPASYKNEQKDAT